MLAWAEASKGIGFPIATEILKHNGLVYAERYLQLEMKRLLFLEVHLIELYIGL